MYVRRKLESKIADQERKIGDLERQLAGARAYLDGLRDALKLHPPDGTTPVLALRDGSDLAKVRDILRTEGKPLHVDELLKLLGKEATRNSKGALAGSLGSYARKAVIFTRPAPNTFGLIEFEDGQQGPVEPPPDFGTK